MSVEAISWALNSAPVPADRGGQPSSACKFVLVGLANHAGPDGTGAFPSVATLVRYTGLSERTVRTCLDRLEAAAIIAPCDPDIVAARIKRADRRPQGWDLNLSQVSGDLDEAGSASRTSARQALLTERLRRAHDDHLHRVQPLHLAAAPVDNCADGCSTCTPQPERGATRTHAGCSRRGRGVQRLHPNRTRNRPWNRPPSRLAPAMRRPAAIPGRTAAGQVRSSQPSVTRGG